MGWASSTKTWNGQTVYQKDGTLSDLVAELPEFEKAPFGMWPAINEDLEQIVRKPTAEDIRAIPVGIVSTQYGLIQHGQVVNWLREGMSMAGLDEGLCSATLFLSRYGERMLLRVKLYGLRVDPGDGYPLQTYIMCQNSVDRSLALEYLIMKVREICSNGLILGQAYAIRKAHVQRNPQKLRIAKGIEYILRWAGEASIEFSQWLKTTVTQEQIDHWVDTTIQEKWGNKDAARVAAICRTGWDGDVIRVKDAPPSRIPVGRMEVVPGSCAPVNNVYHAAQALSWVASRELAIDARLAKIRHITDMVEQLFVLD